MFNKITGRKLDLMVFISLCISLITGSLSIFYVYLAHSSVNPRLSLLSTFNWSTSLFSNLYLRVLIDSGYPYCVIHLLLYSLSSLLFYFYLHKFLF